MQGNSFVSMESKGCRHDVYSYNILINGYCKDRNVEDAVSLCREMLSEGIRADATTYNTLFVSFKVVWLSMQ